jgi:hypothetical protein
MKRRAADRLRAATGEAGGGRGGENVRGGGVEEREAILERGPIGRWALTGRGGDGSIRPRWARRTGHRPRLGREASWTARPAGPRGGGACLARGPAGPRGAS